MYPLIETICIIDGAIQNLEWHQKRYESSYAKMYAKSNASTIVEGLLIPKKYTQGVCKLRISYNESQKKYAFEKYIKKSVNSLKLIIDNNLEYSLKYANRSSLNKLVKLKESCDDILIIKNDKITDTSYANILFTNGDRWFTPTTPLLKGTCRARLLAEKNIEEMDICINDLKNFKGFQLINAMNDLDRNSYIEIENIKM